MSEATVGVRVVTDLDIKTLDKCAMDVVATAKPDALLVRGITLPDETRLPPCTPLRRRQDGFWEPII